MRKTHRTWTQKDIRLPKTARIARQGLIRSNTGLFRAGRPRGANRKPAAQSAVKTGTGGADRDRTDDLRLAKPALSQLSYSPTRRSAERGGPG